MKQLEKRKGDCYFSTITGHGGTLVIVICDSIEEGRMEILSLTCQRI